VSALADTLFFASKNKLVVPGTDGSLEDQADALFLFFFCLPGEKRSRIFVCGNNVCFFPEKGPVPALA
jgi:hypothetical protein